jgi:hypothetical protein
MCSHFRYPFAATALLAACSEFPTPAELAQVQILAVRAEPPALVAGESARLAVLVAGPAGTVEPELVHWSMADALPARIEIGDTGAATLVATSEVTAPHWIELAVTVQLEGGHLLRARKSIRVGGGRGANPLVHALQVDGSAHQEGEPLRTAPGTALALQLDAGPELGESAGTSWFATTGELAFYRRASTHWTAPAEPAHGHLYAVYRDGAGGVAWRSHELLVE